MAKAKSKTVPHGLSVSDYIAAIEKDDRRADCQRLLDVMTEMTGWEPKIWGSSLKLSLIHI